MEGDIKGIIVRSPLIVRNNLGLYPRALEKGFYPIFNWVILTGRRKGCVFFCVGGSEDGLGLGLFAEELEMAKKAGIVEMRKEEKNEEELFFLW